MTGHLVEPVGRSNVESFIEPAGDAAEHDPLRGNPGQ
jgi:hypothetical protein